MEGLDQAPDSDPEPGRLLDWSGVGQGVAVGLAGATLVGIAVSVLDRMGLADETKDRLDLLLLLAVMAAYALAGATAGRRSPRAPLANGAAAAIGAFVCWIPLRVVIWAVRGDEHGLVSGHDAVLTFSGVYSQVLIATTFGMIGGWIGARRARIEATGRTGPHTDPSDEPQPPTSSVI